MNDGNEIQTAQTIAAVADAAVARYAAGNPEKRLLGRDKTEWGVILSLIVSSASLIFSGGYVYGQVQKNSAEIERLRADRDSEIDRLARIETKVDILVGNNGRERQ